MTPTITTMSAWSMVWFRWGCTASCGWNVRCVGVRGDTWSVMLSPCNTPTITTNMHTTSTPNPGCTTQPCVVLSFGAMPGRSCFLRV